MNPFSSSLCHTKKRTALHYCEQQSCHGIPSAPPSRANNDKTLYQPVVYVEYDHNMDMDPLALPFGGGTAVIQKRRTPKNLCCCTKTTRAVMTRLLFVGILFIILALLLVAIGYYYFFLLRIDKTHSIVEGEGGGQNVNDPQQLLEDTLEYEFHIDRRLSFLKK